MAKGKNKENSLQNMSEREILFEFSDFEQAKKYWLSECQRHLKSCDKYRNKPNEMKENLVFLIEIGQT